MPSHSCGQWAWACLAWVRIYRSRARAASWPILTVLGHGQQRIRLALALTMALPGTPVLMYGDEIGMGEDLSLPGRIAVRNPMQWSPGHAGGFSYASKLYRPARADGPYGYRAVNVLDQRHDPGSLYSWVAHAIRVRRECPELGWGQWRTIRVGDPRVLVIEARWRDGRMITLHNLSADTVAIPLQDDIADLLARASQVLGDPKPSYRPGQEITLGRYGFRWLRLPD
jgi:maltose alpha-D-glucosyltransferase/alpha-amylase